jgi:ribosomal protein L7Ae-like RNA K-turn-binding protein
MSTALPALSKYKAVNVRAVKTKKTLTHAFLTSRKMEGCGEFHVLVVLSMEK